jgi:hypothetical protein
MIEEVHIILTNKFFLAWKAKDCLVSTLLQVPLTNLCTSRATLWAQVLYLLQVVRLQGLLTKDPPNIVKVAAMFRVCSSAAQVSLSELSRKSFVFLVQLSRK